MGLTCSLNFRGKKDFLRFRFQTVCKAINSEKTKLQGNANQNDDDISPHPSQNGSYQKRQELTRVGEDVEKKKPLVPWWRECKLVQLLL